MSIRETINKNPLVGVVIVVVILVIVVMMIRSNGPVGENPLAYYYDLQSGELFVANKDDVPPIEAPSGAGNGVLAAVFACGSCENEADRFVGWVSKYDPQVHEQVRLLNASPMAVDAAGNPIDAMAVNAYAYIAVLPETVGDDVEWISLNAPQVQFIREAPFTKCPEGAAVQTCYPSM